MNIFKSGCVLVLLASSLIGCGESDVGQYKSSVQEAQQGATKADIEKADENKKKLIGRSNDD